MEEKKPYLSCNCNGKIHLAIFVFPLSYVIIRFLHDKIFLFSKPINSFKILKYNLPYLFYLYLPKILSILFLPIIKSNTKSESISEKGNIVLRKYHLLTIIKNKKCRK